MKKTTFALLATLGLSAGLASCNTSTVYDKFEHTPINGWEKNDTLSFEIPRFSQAGTYETILGLRITSTYPFMKLTLVATTERVPNKNNGEYDVWEDTLQCNLIDDTGKNIGQGVSYYQYNIPIHLRHFDDGDSIHVSIRHDMKREILPGVSDIGIKITRRD